MKKIKKETWMGLFIIFILVFSVLGYMWGSQQTKSQFSYGKLSFTQRQDKWVTKINKQEFGFDFLPQDVDYINMSEEITNKLANTIMLSITFEPNHTKELEYLDYIRFDLENTQKPNLFINSGVVYNTSKYNNLRIIACRDSTLSVPVIKFIKSNQTKIYEENNCIIAEAKNDNELLRVKDRILYAILGVIE